MRVNVEISPGELYDKLTILGIKEERIDDPSKRARITAEKHALNEAAAAALNDVEGLDLLTSELRRINEALWVIEDKIRDHEARGDFGDGFIELARSVYLTNDRRAAVKRQIDELFGSDIGEVKSYRSYARI